MPKDPDPVTIKVATEADTSGIDAASTALKGLSGDGDGSAEIEKVTTSLTGLDDAAKEVGESAKETDLQLARMINIQRAQIAAQVASSVAQIGGAVKNLADDLRGSDKELAETLDNSAVALDSLTGALSLAAQGFAVGGPFGAAIGATVGLLTGPLKSAYDGMVNDLDNAAKAEKNAAASVERLRKAREDFVREVRDKNIRAIFDSETTAIDNTIKALEKKARLDALQRGADSEINKVFGAPQSPQQAIETGRAEKFAEIDADVKLAADLAKQAGRHALDAMANASRVIEAQGELAPEAIKAANERDSAIRAADDASAKAREIEEAAAIEKQKITAQVVGELQNFSAEVSNTILEQAAAAKTAMEQAAKAEGDKFPANSRAALESLVAIFNDAIPDSAQLDQISTVMVQFRDSQRGVNQTITENMNAMIANSDQLKETQRTIAAKIASQSQDIENLRQQVLSVGESRY